MAIFDAYGQEYSPPRMPDMRGPGAVMVRDRWSSYPSKGLTPERLAAILKEADQGDIYRQSELFEEMEEKDGHLASVLQTRKLAVGGLSWEILPASDDDRAREYAEYIEGALRSFDDWDGMILDLMDSVGKGQSLSTLTWSMDDGQALIVDSQWIHPKNLTFIGKQGKRLNAPRLLTKTEPVYGEDLVPFQYIYHQYKGRSGHPSRQGLLRVCAWMYLFKNYDLKDWVAFAEVFGMPLRVGRFDPNTSEPDKETLYQAVVNLGSDAAAIISKSTDIEIIKTEAKGSADFYQKLADYCDKQNSKAVLGQTATTDETPGRLGGGQEKDAVRQDLLEADAKAMQKILRKDIFRPIIGFNKGWDQIDLTPYLKFAYEPPEDRQMEANTYKTVIRDIGLPVSWQHLYEKFGIPEPQQGEETVGRSEAAPPGARQLGLSVKLDDQSLIDKNRQATMDDLADEALGESAGKFKELLKPVQQLINGASSLHEIRLELAGIYPQMDTKDLEDLVAKAVLLAELAGRLSVKET